MVIGVVVAGFVVDGVVAGFVDEVVGAGKNGVDGVDCDVEDGKMQEPVPVALLLLDILKWHRVS